MGTGSLSWGKAAGAWRWPPTPFTEAFIACSRVHFTFYGYDFDNAVHGLTEDKGSSEHTWNTTVQGGRTAVPVNLTGPDSSSTQGTQSVPCNIMCWPIAALCAGCAAVNKQTFQILPPAEEFLSSCTALVAITGNYSSACVEFRLTSLHPLLPARKAARVALL